MNAATSILVGLFVGLVWGLVLRGLRTAPIAQSILALQLGWMFSGFATGLITMLENPRRQGILPVSFGLSEFIIGILVLAILGAAVHGLLAVLSRGSLFFLRNRTIILGILGGICGSLAARYVHAGAALQR